MKIFYIVFTLTLILGMPNAFGQGTEDDLRMFGAVTEQSLEIEITADGSTHVTHNVERGTYTPRFVEFVKGTASNIEVYDSRTGEEVEFGVAGYGDAGGVQLFVLSPVKIEYDLDDAIRIVDGIWYWDFRYLASTKFYLPEGVDFVYVNDRYAELAGAKGLHCHGCGLELAYYINAENTIKNIEWESEKFPIEVISQNKLVDFNFMQSDKIISFETEIPQLITLKIPLRLLWNPYQVYFVENSDYSSLITPENVTKCDSTQDKVIIQGTAKCYDKIFNNEIEADENHVLLTIHPKKAGAVVILGTSAIPEFPLFMPLVIGVLMVVLLQFRSKISFNV